MTKRTLKKFDKRRGERHYADYYRKLNDGIYARQDWFRRNNVFIFGGISKLIDCMIPGMVNNSFSQFANVRDLGASTDGFQVGEYINVRECIRGRRLSDQESRSIMSPDIPMLPSTEINATLEELAALSTEYKKINQNNI